jgi:hypothetical protein
MRIFVVTLVTLAALGLGACEREGPAERAGKQVDEAIGDAGDAVKDAGDKVKDAVDDDE